MKLFLAIACLLLSLCGVQAQQVAPRTITPPCTAPCTQQQLLNDVQTQFPDNTVGAITPSVLRTFFNNLLNSTMATSPLVNGQPVCYYGTTGLPGTCTAALGIAQGGTGAVTQPAAAANIFPTPVRAGDIAMWNGSAWGTIPGNNGTTGLLQQTNTGAPSWVSGSSISSIVLPTPTRNGDILYWNGSAWITILGNNSGTQALTEGPTGVPAWAPYIASPGTVTSVNIAAGYGISVTGTCTITTTGTCTASAGLTSMSISTIADVALNNTANYFDGPSLAQGTTGTWWAAGTATLTDTSVSPNATFYCKLWDGTTVIDSSASTITTSNLITTIALSGPIASPAGNIRISCRDISGTTGKMLYNNSSNAKDSTVSAMRLQ